jgi:hypothetical protein
MPPDEPPPAKPAWRTVHHRTPRKPKLKKEPPPPAPGPDPGPDPRRQVRSWATWQRELLSNQLCHFVLIYYGNTS